jgi:hypothetical protein
MHSLQGLCSNLPRLAQSGKVWILRRMRIKSVTEKQKHDKFGGK